MATLMPSGVNARARICGKSFDSWNPDVSASHFCATHGRSILRIARRGTVAQNNIRSPSAVDVMHHSFGQAFPFIYVQSGKIIQSHSVRCKGSEVESRRPR